MKKQRVKTKIEPESKLRIVKSNIADTDEVYPTKGNIIYGRIKSLGKIKVLVMVDSYGRTVLNKIS